MSDNYAYVSGDTEYFNGNEWKKIKDYTPGEKVLQWEFNAGDDLEGYMGSSASLVDPSVYTEKTDASFYSYDNGIIASKLSGNYSVLGVSEDFSTIIRSRMSDLMGRKEDDKTAGYVPLCFISDFMFEDTINMYDEDDSAFLNILYHLVVGAGTSYNSVKYVDGKYCICDGNFLGNVDVKELDEKLADDIGYDVVTDRDGDFYQMNFYDLDDDCFDYHRLERFIKVDSETGEIEGFNMDLLHMEDESLYKLMNEMFSISAVDTSMVLKKRDGFYYHNLKKYMHIENFINILQIYLAASGSNLSFLPREGYNSEGDLGSSLDSKAYSDLLKKLEAYEEESNQYNEAAKAFLQIAKKYGFYEDGNDRVYCSSHRYGTRYDSKFIEKREATEKGYCFVVPSHALVLRYDGRIFVTGDGLAYDAD